MSRFGNYFKTVSERMVSVLKALHGLLKFIIMNTFFTQVSEKAGRVIRNWWILLIVGILSIIAGIVVFCRPVESYITLSLMFGVLMLITGTAELVTSLSSRNYFMMRGYNLVGAVLDILLGLFLCFKPEITLLVLPILLGIWALFHSFMLIGFGGDLSGLRVNGSGWIIFGGITLLLLSLMIILNPFSFGTAAVVILTGVVLILFGMALLGAAGKLRKLHSYLESYTIDEQ